MSSSAAASLMACCIITDRDYDLITGNDGVDTVIDQILQDNDLYQVTNFEGVGPMFVGITYHEVNEENCDTDKSRLSLEMLQSIDIRTARAKTVHILMNMQEPTDTPELKAALVKLILFVQTTDTWAIRLIPRYG